MNCFMSYNPNVAKEVKITTWIKEFDGASPVYPSFPNEGDVFIVFDTDEAKEPSVNKTYTSGDWADTSSGGGGGGMDMPTFTVTVGTGGTATATCDKTYNECKELCTSNDYANTYFCMVVFEGDIVGQEVSIMQYIPEDEPLIISGSVAVAIGTILYSADGTLSAEISR